MSQIYYQPMYCPGKSVCPNTGPLNVIQEKQDFCNWIFREKINFQINFSPFCINYVKTRRQSQPYTEILGQTDIKWNALFEQVLSSLRV